MMDIELLAQTAALIAGSDARDVESQLEAGVAGDVLSVSDQTVLQNAYRLYWPVQAAARLLSETTLDIGQLGIGARAYMLRETPCANEAELAKHLDASATAIAAVLRRVLGIEAVT